MRTNYCGQLNSAHIDQKVTLSGWVNRRRDLGGLIFIDMRDREGIVQVSSIPTKKKHLPKPLNYGMNSVFRLPELSARDLKIKLIKRWRPAVWKCMQMA